MAVLWKEEKVKKAEENVMLRSLKGNEFSYLFNYAMEVSLKLSF